MRSKIVVIKYGGAAMQSPKLIESIMDDIAQLKASGMYPVLVHGGGPEISKMCQKVGIIPTFIQGLRVTDHETLEIAQMVMVGKINKELVSQLNRAGGKAIGLSGHDGALLCAKQIDPSLGFVGEIEQVNTAVLITLIQNGFIPVITPIGISKDFQSYNINADSAAAAIAIALKADHLIFLTDVAGVMRDPNDLNTKISKIKNSEIQILIQEGILQGGMLPKINGASVASQGGVKQVHILDGRIKHCLSLHFQGAEPQGTTIYV